MLHEYYVVGVTPDKNVYVIDLADEGIERVTEQQMVGFLGIGIKIHGVTFNKEYYRKETQRKAPTADVVEKSLHFDAPTLLFDDVLHIEVNHIRFRGGIVMSVVYDNLVKNVAEVGVYKNGKYKKGDLVWSPNFCFNLPVIPNLDNNKYINAGLYIANVDPTSKGNIIRRYMYNSEIGALRGDNCNNKSFVITPDGQVLPNFG